LTGNRERKWTFAEVASLLKAADEPQLEELLLERELIKKGGHKKGPGEPEEMHAYNADSGGREKCENFGKKSCWTHGPLCNKCGKKVEPCPCVKKANKEKKNQEKKPEEKAGDSALFTALGEKMQEIAQQSIKITEKMTSLFLEKAQPAEGIAFEGVDFDDVEGLEGLIMEVGWPHRRSGRRRCRDQVHV
jgi:hypothetical protein